MGFELTGGEASDSIQFKALMQAGPVENPRAIVADKGYDSDANRKMAREVGALIAPDSAPASMIDTFIDALRLV